MRHLSVLGTFLDISSEAFFKSQVRHLLFLRRDKKDIHNDEILMKYLSITWDHYENQPVDIWQSWFGLSCARWSYDCTGNLYRNPRTILVFWVHAQLPQSLQWKKFKFDYSEHFSIQISKPSNASDVLFRIPMLPLGACKTRSDIFVRINLFYWTNWVDLSDKIGGIKNVHTCLK